MTLHNALDMCAYNYFMNLKWFWQVAASELDFYFDYLDSCHLIVTMAPGMHTSHQL